MEPISIGLGVASLASSLAGLFGGDDSKKYMDQAIQELIRVKIPNPEAQRLALERYQSAGEITPELERAIASDPSAFESVVQNQKYAQAQDRALEQLQTLGEEGGLSLSDKADLQEQMIANANKDKASRDAITDEMARRGQLGSGMALQAQLQGAQAAGDRDATSRLRTLGSAQDRAFQAIMGSGELAGKLDAQDYQRQSDLAQARDRINQFNVENARGVQTRNVAMRNDANRFNLENRQNLMNANTDMANQEQRYNKELEQQRFENEMAQAQAKASVYTGQAQQSSRSADRRNAAFGSVGSALNQAGAGWQNYQNQKKRY